MRDFIARVNFTCKNLLNKEVSFKEGEYIDELKGYFYKDGIPFCTTTSQIARDKFIWAGDGHETYRMEYENIILFNNRIKVWDVEIPVYDGSDIIGYKTAKRTGRFSPTEIEYIRENFSDLLEKDSFLFNDYFYKGSDISRVKELAEYLSR